MAQRNIHLAIRRRACSSCRTAACSTRRACGVGRDSTPSARGISTVLTVAAAGFTGWVTSWPHVLATQLLDVTGAGSEVAFENWKADAAKRGTAVSADRDIYETSAIAANKRLRANIGALRLRLTGADLSGFDVKGFRQRLTGDTLTITREGPDALHAKYRLPDGAKASMMAVFLDPEPLLETQTRISSCSHGSAEGTRILASWRSASTDGCADLAGRSRRRRAWRRCARRGDCNERTQPPSRFARRGIPRRSRSRVSRRQVLLPRVAGACRSVIAVDPTFDGRPADAAHLRLTVGGLGGDLPARWPPQDRRPGQQIASARPVPRAGRLERRTPLRRPMEVLCFDVPSAHLAAHSDSI